MEESFLLFFPDVESTFSGEKSLYSLEIITVVFDTSS